MSQPIINGKRRWYPPLSQLALDIRYTEDIINKITIKKELFYVLVFLIRGRQKQTADMSDIEKLLEESKHSRIRNWQRDWTACSLFLLSFQSTHMEHERRGITRKDYSSQYKKHHPRDNIRGPLLLEIGKDDFPKFCIDIIYRKHVTYHDLGSVCDSV